MTMMSGTGVRDFGRASLAGWLVHQATFCLWSLTVVLQIAAGQDCPPCPELQSTFNGRIERFFNYNCTGGQATYHAEVSCLRGFQQTVTAYTSMCICDKDFCQWEAEGSCHIDVLGVILSVIGTIVIVSVFIILMCIVVRTRGCKRGWNKAMYDTSHDGSIIDGHREEDGGVVNISMADVPPSPRIIPIEDSEELDSENLTQAEVHYENVLADGGGGTKLENGMLPGDPQAGTSTEKLIDDEREEPDGQDELLAPYASIGDFPVDRAQRPGSLEASVGGSVKVRPVTLAPDLKDRSATVRPSGAHQGEPLYARINKVKRASDRWPPRGSKEPSRPHGRRAGIDDLLNHIDAPESPTEPTAKGADDMYAEVDAERRDQASVESSANPIPDAAKPVRNSSKASSGGRKIKRYIPPSQREDHGDLYAVIDKKRPSKKAIISTNLGPPSPPPLAGMDGLYAQIDRDGRSRKEPVARHNDRESPISTDEGFVDHSTTRV